MGRGAEIEVFALVVCGLVQACGQGKHSPDQTAPADEALATVNGTPLLRADLASVEGDDSLSIRERIERAVDAELLAQEASAQGVSSHELTRRTRQLAVQELLRVAVETPNQPEDVSWAALEERYSQNRGEKFVRPERRASLHFLVRLPDDAAADRVEAAKHIAQEAWRSMRDEDSARALLQRNKTEKGGFALVAEYVPPASRQAALDPAYRDALFDAQGVGRIGKVVRSSFGWHAIWLASIEPAVRVPLDQVEAELRNELAVERRRAALEALIEKLRANSKVVVGGDKLRDVLGESFDLAKIGHEDS